ncbi:TraR/DksA family transcriptional regulator [Lentisphaera profundi]|uniref:TraR/DksA family transcriptional regulator n=1 Tax=Lentisphaera profundi TaxID=1658616 RepID=A0ABY7W179_9BACT|nr:TraR/DksA family transcriptional regulator [Lentisphaera profundi]WDE98786.1 TraR/DksA family transcriptional regulator [Lentisphaera profundi]
MSTRKPTQVDIQLDLPRYRGNKKQRYEQLIDLRAQLVDQVSMLNGVNLQVDRNAGEDGGDVGSDNFMREINLNVMSDEGIKVQLVQQAIERLDQGKYGRCVDCREDIAEARLDALPYAKLCVGCKSTRESQGVAHFTNNTIGTDFTE